MAQFCEWCAEMTPSLWLGYHEVSLGAVQDNFEGNYEQHYEEEDQPQLEKREGHSEEELGYGEEEVEELPTPESLEDSEDSMFGSPRGEEMEDTDEESVGTEASGWSRGEFRDVIKQAETCVICRQVVPEFCAWASARYGPIKFDRMLSSDYSSHWEYIPHEFLPADDNDDDDNKPRTHSLKTLQLTVGVRDPDSPEYWIGLTINFLKSSAHPPSVTTMLDMMGETLDWPAVEEPYISRTRPAVADLRLFKKWYQCCEQGHGTACYSGERHHGERPPMMRFIDVEDQCLVELDFAQVDGDNGGGEGAATNITWVALSYVWGKRPLPMLKQALLETFRRPGSLSGDWIPATIADAIEVTRALGERYLWVDCLCIVQDSDVDKMLFIPRMHVIYGLAAVTIINAAGADAFSGLPGVRPDTRPCGNESFRFSSRVADDGDGDGDDDGDDDDGASTWMVKSLNPLKTYFDGNGYSQLPWFLRAWTLQEVILSPRWLMFVPGQVLWECRRATWLEEACWEQQLSIPLQPGNSSSGGGVYYHSMIHDHELFHQRWKPGTQGFDEAYQKLVKDYTRRDMTYDNDSLNAVQSILDALEEVYGIDFLWGLPKPFLGTALGWPIDTNSEHEKRRGTCKVQQSTDGAIVEVRFPTWSWVAWRGRSLFDDSFFYHLDYASAGLEYYVLSDDGAAVVHIPQHTEFRQKEIPPSPEVRARSVEPSWRGDTNRRVELSDVPAPLTVPEIRPTVLMFWTSCCEVEYDPSARINSCFAGLSTGLFGQLPPKGFKGPAELVVVGRGGIDLTELVLFVVEKSPAGSLNRVGQCVVEEADWNNLPNRRWELVFLT